MLADESAMKLNLSPQKANPLVPVLIRIRDLDLNL